MNDILRFGLTVVISAMPLSVLGQSPQLEIVTLSAGAARLDNGSIVNIGQPLIGTFGSAQAGITGGVGIVSVLRPLAGPSTPPKFDSAASVAGGVILLTFQVEPGWTYRVEASTNLIQWSSLWTTHAVVSTITFEDFISMPLDLRFYRVVAY